MPEEFEVLPVEIHLPGLLKVLGEHLYSNPRVAMRELIQNAHDSCVRRREEDSTVTTDYQPAISVRIDHAGQKLLIEDNGSGLTHDEITTFLATVGRGYTRELREKLGGAEREEALELIGMFGLGLLSAFMIATKIEITTTSYQTPDEAWRWVSEGGQSYALHSASRETVGTTVRLDLREDAQFLLDRQVLSEALKVYVEFLSIPITVGAHPTPLNNHPAPWMLPSEAGSGRNALYASWLEEHFNIRPLSVLPLEDIINEDGTVIPLHGVLYVPPSSIISIQEYGNVTVYVRHMLITENERDLLPPWARFVTGIIDCPLLNPTASRETLRHDEIYSALRDALGKALLAHFTYLAEHAPLDWSAIIQAHNDLIKGWAVRASDFFLRVADLVSFKTSRGQLTLPEYLHENPGRIFYYHDIEGVTQALALFEARRLAVIDARWFADVSFLRTYSEVYGIPIEELTPAAGYIFTPVTDADGSWQAVITACRAEGFPVRLLAYEPEHLPMILLYPPGAEKTRRAQRNMDEQRFAGPIRSLVRNYLQRQQVDEAVMKGVLHLNARNPLLRRVRDLRAEHPHFVPLLSILVANARMFAGQGLSAQDTIACFEQINTSLARLAEIEAPVSSGLTALTTTMLTDLGLHPDAAARLCAACETVEALLAGDTHALAEQARISSLMLATIREELKQRAAHSSVTSETPIVEEQVPARENERIISLVEVKEHKPARQQKKPQEEE
ncbi:MAG TPA: ATP-binding protein [Ktedonobacteraceae bacterium]